MFEVAGVMTVVGCETGGGREDGMPDSSRSANASNGNVTLIRRTRPRSVVVSEGMAETEAPEPDRLEQASESYGAEFRCIIREFPVLFELLR